MILAFFDNFIGTCAWNLGDFGSAAARRTKADHTLVVNMNFAVSIPFWAPVAQL